LGDELASSVDSTVKTAKSIFSGIEICRQPLNFASSAFHELPEKTSVNDRNARREAGNKLDVYTIKS
jgi:hypothetical protein